jgi:hypothetical protein
VTSPSGSLMRSTGELIDLSGAPAGVIGQIAEDIDQRIADLRSDKRALSDEITARLDHEGRRSMEIDGWRFETTAPEEREFDVPELQGVLAELVAEGTISQAKADKCIEWVPKPVWIQIKPLTADPRCKERVNHAISMRPAARYGKVKRG